MTAQIRITVEHLVGGEVTQASTVLDEQVKPVKSIMDLGFSHQQQVDIIKGCQESLLKAQSATLKEDIITCPRCGSQLKLAGTVSSHFHAVFSDHKVPVKRQKCRNKTCGWTSVPSISSLFKTNLHPDLAKLQTEMACAHTYREAEKLMNSYSYYPRKINNHDRLRHVVEQVGNYISEYPMEAMPDNLAPIEELVCQVDGGHLKSTQSDERSFEALAAVVYSPEHVIYPEQSTTDTEAHQRPRGTVTSKHCAASALDDDLATIKRQIRVAALKQGMTAETTITAVCDGAENCWQVVQSLEHECHSITRILDWFHIAKRFQNISLPKTLIKKLERAKWCIWHGQFEKSIRHLTQIIERTRVEKMKIRLTTLLRYLENNQSYLVDYAKRHQAGKIIASSLAESTVESLINNRCKGKQHMKWTREGAHPLLQVRASCASNDWQYFGAQYVLKAMTEISI